jgi:membrane protein DedA with SNARE-associated domain
MLHGLIAFWFKLLNDWGYFGVVVLMALESSIVPVPSEVVIPPAAYWASQGKMSFWGVVLAGTFGSWIGSAISYWVSLWVGRAFILKFGKWVHITPDKVERAERFVHRTKRAEYFCPVAPGCAPPDFHPGRHHQDELPDLQRHDDCGVVRLVLHPCEV